MGWPLRGGAETRVRSRTTGAEGRRGTQRARIAEGGAAAEVLLLAQVQFAQVWCARGAVEAAANAQGIGQLGINVDLEGGGVGRIAVVGVAATDIQVE